MIDPGQLQLSVSMILIASIAVVSILAWIVKPLKRALILNPYLVVERFQVHRLLTAGWLHADVSHLAFNMLTLYFFADKVESALGTGRFLLLYISAVVIAHVPTVIRRHKDPKYNSLGASGAVAAVMFSAILLFPGMKLALIFLPIPIPAMLYALGYLIYSVIQSLRGGDGINHDAHFTGAIYGALLTFAFESDRVTRTLQQLFS